MEEINIKETEKKRNPQHNQSKHLSSQVYNEYLNNINVLKVKNLKVKNSTLLQLKDSIANSLNNSNRSSIAAQKDERRLLQVKQNIKTSNSQGTEPNGEVFHEDVLITSNPNDISNKEDKEDREEFNEVIINKVHDKVDEENDMMAKNRNNDLNLLKPLQSNLNVSKTFSIKELIDSSDDDLEEEYDKFSMQLAYGKNSKGLYSQDLKDHALHTSTADNSLLLRSLEIELVKAINDNTISKLIFNCDLGGIEELIKKMEKSPDLVSKVINTEDARNIQPLFLCIYLREAYRDKDEEKRKIYLEIIKLFIKYHVKIRIRNEDKRTPLEEAVSYNDQELVEVIYDRALINRENKIKFSKEKANVFLESTPDFYCEMKWEVNVPLLSFLCPNDTCKVWKKGSNIRMDYTFIQMKNLSTIRAPSSYIYTGNSGHSSLVNWETKKWYDPLEALDPEEKKLIIEDIMDGTRLNSEIKLKNCTFSESLNWREKPVFEKINNWNSQKYDVKVAAVFDLHHQQIIEYDQIENKEMYFDFSKTLPKTVTVVSSNDEAKNKIGKKLNLKNDMVKKQLESLGKNKEKNVSAQVW
eukprot:CAMPEP_0170528098 /NCGR_PEP_ID=MMETSP0209-20121228/13590_1 /TAXON_ID=665100 ORGANISM="Litonotus pictus, Strain P1" /NCGR_SAMPLE_ID=MMETSP0209 /ASSEMBLY_ACC=CAM_ASM_000301 /LENGTH=581 /DNA_ID=CAMNT_0010819089 /DNA_START=373 /DNA_END=2115 /DNA_ORIENTATION=+